MLFTLINENRAFINKKDAIRNEQYDVKALLLEMIDIKTAKDFLRFLEKCPYAFFSKYFFEVNDELYDEFFPYREKHIYKGSLQKTVQESYLDIDYLDDLLLREGVLGEIVMRETVSSESEKTLHRAIVSNNVYEWLYLSTIEAIIQNVQRLAELAAIALKECPKSSIKRIRIPKLDFANIVESKLTVTSDMNSDYEAESALPLLFTEDEISDIRKALAGTKYSISNGNLHHDGSYRNKHFVVRAGMSDSEIAAYIFTWFMNSLFEGSAEPYYAGNTFKVSFYEGAFKVKKSESPIRELYYELSKMAESKSFKVCLLCGKAFVDDKSRGNAALYCSRSCNTKASNSRKDKAIGYKLAGVPLEKAIEEIGIKYKNSITRWYENA